MDPAPIKSLKHLQLPTLDAIIFCKASVRTILMTPARSASAVVFRDETRRFALSLVRADKRKGASKQRENPQVGTQTISSNCCRLNER
jgi:hypothetical protein